MPHVINTLRHNKRAKDQTIGAVQRNGIAPTVRGIARDRLIAKAARQAYDSAEAIQGLLNAADSADPNVAGVANFLLGNREFLGAMCKSLEGILADLKAQQQPAPSAAEPSAHSDPTSPVATEAPDDRTRGGSGFPGADKALHPSGPGSYTIAHLVRDLAVEKAAPRFHMQQSGGMVGMDAARQAVSRLQFVPDWDSDVWSDAARAEYRNHALFNGAAATHLARFGDEPRDFKGNRRSGPSMSDPASAVGRYFSE